MSLSSSSSSSSSLETTPNTKLTDDIWFEIFLLLPFISIFKLRSVSKVWSSLLSDPHFISKWVQFNVSDKLPWLVYHNINEADIQLKFLLSHPKSLSPEFMSGNEHGFSFRFLNPESNLENSRIYLLGSSNGLVLCTSSYARPYLRPKDYYVCNPLTHEWVSLPPAPSSTPIEVVIVFTCESISSATSYKVVVIPRFCEPSNRRNIEIFSSDVGKWNVYEVSGIKDSIGRYALVISGVLYWTRGKSILAYNLNNKYVVTRPYLRGIRSMSSYLCKFLKRKDSLESSGQQCRLIDFPNLDSENSYGEKHIYCLGEYEGLLCYAAIVSSQKTLGVWVFEGFWHLLHKDIDLRDLVAEVTNRFYVNEYEDSEGEESAVAYLEEQDMVIKEIEILSFSPVDKNVILLRYKYGIWAYNIQTRGYEELVEPSFVAKTHSGYSVHNLYGTRYNVHCPFALKAMPTMLPPPSWENTSSVNVRASSKKTQAGLFSCFCSFY